MNRQEFFRELEQQLQRIPREEANAALEYYREYFDEAGPENEAQVIAELGSPGSIVTHLKAEVAMKQLQQEEPSVKKGISAIWLVVLAIFAAPLALPLSIGALGLCIGLFIAAVAILVAIAALVVAFLITGIAGVIAGVITLFTSWPTGVFAIGVGFTTFGLSVLLGILLIATARAVFAGIARLIHKSLDKRKKGENAHESNN